MRRKSRYIYDLKQWPDFNWRTEEIVSLLSEVRYLQGRILGRMDALGFDLRNEAAFDTMTLDVIKTSEIEGEILDRDQVRSSLARRLGLDIPGEVNSDRNVDGMVEMMLDASINCFQPLKEDRLFAWHATLFPLGRSGMYPITTANWRTDANGPMQVVSGALGREKIHFRAPDATLVKTEMRAFIRWFNKKNPEVDLVLKAAIAHLWFVTVHPFEDGNGRIARALTDMLLAQSDRSTQRFYSMSAQIRLERKKYYEILERTQSGTMDVTEWIKWFLQCLIRAIQSTESQLNRVLFKADFWSKNATTVMNERQKKMMNKLLDGFEGKLNSSKWARMMKCSNDTAIRDINDLIEKGILEKEDAGGRSTSYRLVC
ncbi:MAG TPA: Fic family protein [Flavobacteriales bacterium]|nr:DUF4172 domain-containing protein [Flavobacteriales bacterium]HRE73142.1 Fic family protein [Flavobacteriales bacterium]HRE96020.1 Fic family protein [Flavobacteriales bacterium]HRJ35711.1 Fic family protein [Flavobacteriales bacterium]HRJ39587.1 Fic family protein [Flavobacteriales bacterium]